MNPLKENHNYVVKLVKTTWNAFVSRLNSFKGLKYVKTQATDKQCSMMTFQ